MNNNLYAVVFTGMMPC